MNKKILIVGFGYTAEYLSNLLLKKDFMISGTTRNPNKIKQWRHVAINLISYDAHTIKKEIKTCTHILIAIPPNADGIDATFDIIKNSLIHNKNHLQWIGYLSATSVYGDHQGKWVDENSTYNSPGARGARRIEAEQRWLSLFHQSDLPVHLFRLAGIYGPKRNSLIRILHGKNFSVSKKGQVFSRIHVTDIVRALYQSISKSTPGEIYNLADELPCASEKVEAYAAQLLHQPPLQRIPFAVANLSPTAKEFYQDCRRVSNKKFKKHFNFQLIYPSYKQGLNSLYQQLKQHACIMN